MATIETAKYIVKKPIYEPVPNESLEPGGHAGVTRGATYLSAAQVRDAEAHIMWGVTYAIPSPNPYVLAHDHPYDEVLFFTGFDPMNIEDLGGVVELQLEDEVHVIDSTCSVYIPAGMKHCPITVKEVHRPYGLAAICLSGRYSTMDYLTPLEVPVG
jgi:hypothetical protein